MHRMVQRGEQEGELRADLEEHCGAFGSWIELNNLSPIANRPVKQVYLVGYNDLEWKVTTTFVITTTNDPVDLEVTGPLIIERLGDGHVTTVAEMESVSPNEPPGRGRVLERVVSKMRIELLPISRAGNPRVPLVVLTMGIMRQPCGHPPR